MDELLQNIRFAVRSLGRRPGFAVVALATLALGIGVNAGMFSILRAVLLAPLPYHDASAIVQVHHVDAGGGAAEGAFSRPDFDDFAASVTSFSHFAAYWHAPGVTELTLTGTGEPAILEAAYVAPEFFPLLGVAPRLGRLPTPAEMREGNDRHIVLSHAVWQSRFGGQHDVVGATVTVNNEPFVVLGVMPPAFSYPAETVQAWVPLSLVTADVVPRERWARYLGAIGRLAPGAQPAAAAAELTTIAGRLAEQHAETNRGWEAVRLQGLREAVIGPVRTPLVVLSAAVGFVLLIACSNLVNLLLARAATRRSEFAVRSALGAGSGRLVRQLVTESTVLALAGGITGVLAASWLTSLMLSVGGADLPRIQEVRLDATVVAFALLLSIIAGVATGVIPALRSAAASAAALREAGRGGTDGPQRNRLRGTLIAAEMALAVVLVIAAGLMVRGLTTLMRVDPGFDAEQVVAVSLRVPSHNAGSLPRSIVYRNQLAERIAALPGVTDVAMAKTLPLEGGGEPFEFSMPGREPATFAPEAGVMIVSPTYFDVLGVPLLQGRVFDERETRRADGTSPGMVPTLVINAAAAQRHFPGEEALGQRLLFGDIPFEVIGVVDDVRHLGLHTPPVATAYVAIDFVPRVSLRYMVRVQGDPRALVAPIRAAIHELDPLQPIAEIVPLRDTIARATARERFLTMLLAAFALMALLLATIGIYGVVAYSVSQRTREMGIRIALGAVPASVARMVVAESAAWWGAGLIAGLILAGAGMRVLQSMVYGVSVTDPATFVLVALLLGGAALLASVVPAVRASRSDPTAAFR